MVVFYIYYCSTQQENVMKWIGAVVFISAFLVILGMCAIVSYDAQMTHYYCVEAMKLDKDVKCWK